MVDFQAAATLDRKSSLVSPGANEDDPQINLLIKGWYSYLLILNSGNPLELEGSKRYILMNLTPTSLSKVYRFYPTNL